MNDNELTNLSLAHKKFVKDLENKGRATATILAYGKDIEQLVDFVKERGKTQVSQIEKKDISDFKNYLTKTKGYTAKTVSRKINSIKAFFRFLKAEDVVDDSPAKSVTHPKYETEPPRVLSELEYRALRDVCRDDVRLSAIIELLLQAGIRIGELASLTLNDIKKDKIIIRPYESHPGRDVPLNKAARAAIDRYLAVRPDSKDKHLFLTKTGNQFLVRNIRTAINRYFKLAGIKDATVNDIRNTFIVHQLKSGVPLVVVSKLVGHKRVVTTEKYLQLAKPVEEKKPGTEIEEL